MLELCCSHSMTFFTNIIIIIHVISRLWALRIHGTCQARVELLSLID